MKFLCLLFLAGLLIALCWPFALLLLILWPFLWLLSIPFRILGIAVEGVIALISAIFFLPARLLGGARPRY